MGLGYRKTSPISLVAIFALVLTIFAAFTLANSGSSESQDIQHGDGEELICHTDNPEECYPKTFVPTHEFRTVHDDQEIPQGLHVRLNITSGKLEAKINVEGEVPEELKGLSPEEQAVLVVEPEQPEEPEIPKGAPEYEPVGAVKKPQHEAGYFYDVLSMIKDPANRDATYDDALEWLEDLSHDMYYGLKLAEDPQAMKELLCLMSDDTQSVVEGVVPRDQRAATIIAAALSNNPAALQKVADQWSDLKGMKCLDTQKTLSEEFTGRQFIPEGDAVHDPASPGRVKAKVSAVNNMMKNDNLRKEFVDSDMMKYLLEVLVPTSPSWMTAQRKVGQLALDNFLDEDMGAVLGQWPAEETKKDKECKEGSMEDGCWDYRVNEIAQNHKGDESHWSGDLAKRLAEARKLQADKSSASDEKVEL
jgi:nucleotide exchange factor SIL1